MKRLLNRRHEGGKYIYLGKGKTAIDYEMVNINAWSNIVEFSMEDEISSNRPNRLYK